MQQIITRASLIGSILLVMASFGFYDALLMFVLVGAIPGTNDTLSPTAMSILISVCIASIIAVIALPRVANKMNTVKSARHLKNRYSHS